MMERETSAISKVHVKVRVSPRSRMRSPCSVCRCEVDDGRLARAVVVRNHRNLGARVDEEQLAGTLVVDVYPPSVTNGVQGMCPERAFQFSAGAEAAFSRDSGLTLHGWRHKRALLLNLAW